jgi:hypothetical protein
MREIELTEDGDRFEQVLSQVSDEAAILRQAEAEDVVVMTLKGYTALLESLYLLRYSVHTAKQDPASLHRQIDHDVR